MALLQRFLENLLPAEPLVPAPSTRNPEPEPDYGVDGAGGAVLTREGGGASAHGRHLVVLPTV